MREYQIMYWQDVPAQVRVFDGRKPISKVMPERFQKKIDRIAMAKDLAGTDAYLEHWQWTERRQWEGDDDITQILESLVRELVQEHDRQADAS